MTIPMIELKSVLIATRHPPRIHFFIIFYVKTSEKTPEMAIFRIDNKSGDFCKQSYMYEYHFCVDGKNGGFVK